MGTTTFSESELRSIFSGCPSGVVAVCASVDDRPVGMAVSTFVPASLSPPLVGIFIQNSSRTWPVLARAERIGISVLGAGNEAAAKSLARREGDRFGSIETTTGEARAIFVHGATMWLEGTIWSTTQAGDHTMVLLEVNSARTHDAAPLIFHSSTFHHL